MEIDQSIIKPPELSVHSKYITTNFNGMAGLLALIVASRLDCFTSPFYKIIFNSPLFVAFFFN